MYKEKEEGRSIYYEITRNLRNLIQMMIISQVKMYLDGGLYIDYIFTFFIGNNCMTLSREHT